MGARLVGNTIWIHKELLKKITPDERKILLAHEISHYQNKDNIKMLLLKPMEKMFPEFAKEIRRGIENRADMFAIKKTKNIKAFKTLLDKLNRDDNYPTKEFSLNMANNMAGKI